MESASASPERIRRALKGYGSFVEHLIDRLLRSLLADVYASMGKLNAKSKT